MEKCVRLSFCSIFDEKYQQNAWEESKKIISHSTEELNSTNLQLILKKMLRQVNIHRGRGLLTRAIIEKQEKSPQLSSVYAAFFATINLLFPIIGELLVRRLILRFMEGQKNKSTPSIHTSAVFISYLFYHHIVNEVLIVQILWVLLSDPSSQSVQIVISILSICSDKLSHNTKISVFHLISEYRSTTQLEPSVSFIVDLFLEKFQDICYKIGSNELEVTEKKIQISHLFQLDSAIDPEDVLDRFNFEPNYEKIENRYEERIVCILGYNEAALKAN